MKTFKVSSLPDSINYKGVDLRLNAFVSGAMNNSGTMPNVINKTLKKEGRIGVLVLCLSPRLRGKSDLNGNPYQPTKFIYTN